MTNYGLNFGFRRSGGDAATREGRFRVPLTGTFRQGQLVTVDPDNAGFIKLAEAGAAIVPGVTGLLIQHEPFGNSIFAAPHADTFDMGGIKNGDLCTIWSSAGIKIWLKNTLADTTRPGRSIPARTVLTATGLALGDNLEWDGAKFVKATTGTAVATVVSTNGVDNAEATLLA